MCISPYSHNIYPNNTTPSSTTDAGAFVGPTAAPVSADGATIIYATKDQGLLVRGRVLMVMVMIDICMFVCVKGGGSVGMGVLVCVCTYAHTPTPQPFTFHKQTIHLQGVATDLGRELWGYGANPSDISAVAAVVSGGKAAVVPSNRWVWVWFCTC